MATTTLYCVSTICMAMSDWKDFVSITGTIIAIPSVLFGAYKAWKELQRINAKKILELEKREQEHQLKRLEFTLATQRRLYDDLTLYSVVQMLDSDAEALRSSEMFEAKRKFITFIEEVVLISNAGYIQKVMALYMFGYYALCAHQGENFKYGINYIPVYWCVFISFAEEADQFFKNPTSIEISNLRI